MSEKSDERSKRKRLIQWLRRALLVLVLAVILMPIAFMLANYLIKRQLSSEIVKISRAGEPLTFSNLRAGLKPSGTDEDAARYYNEALLSIIPDDSLEKLKRANVFYRRNVSFLSVKQFPDEPREKLTQSLIVFQPILRKFDKGADIDLSSPVISIEQGIQMCRSRLRHLQAAALLLSLRTLDFILQGKSDAAVNSVISMLKMIRIFNHRPIIVLHAVKVRFVSLACEDVYLLLTHSRPSGESLARLQKALSETIPKNALERVFLTERVYQLGLAKNLMPENTISQLLGDNVPDLPERLLMPTSPLRRLRMRQKAIQYFRDMARLITASREPWPKPLDEIVSEMLKPGGKPSNLMSTGSNFIVLAAQTAALVRSTMLTVAVERYRRSHGEPPGSLDDVSGTYIDSVPSDPFTGRGLLYNYDEESYVVYSVGINRRDDKGAVGPVAAGKIPLDRGLRIRFGEPE